VSPGQQPGDKEATQYEIARASIPATKPIQAWPIATPGDMNRQAYRLDTAGGQAGVLSRLMLRRSRIR
jgi:hypothetical protein